MLDRYEYYYQTEQEDRVTLMTRLIFSDLVSCFNGFKQLFILIIVATVNELFIHNHRLLNKTLTLYWSG